MPAVRCARILLVTLLSAAMPCAFAQAWDDVAPDAAGSAAIQLPVDEQVEAAVAAVLVPTLGSEFGEAMLELRLGDARAEVTGARDHVVHGVGQLRLTGDGGADDWLAFRYRTRYDPVFATAGYPEIMLGGDGAGEDEHFVPNDAGLLVELEARVGAELEAYPGAGRVFLQLDDISSMQSGKRFIRIEAHGLADFGPGGNTSARIDALYDLHAHAWLSVEHALGPNINALGDFATAGP
ncbi:hypothetical protein [Luteimonas terricola]|uniref:Uncharacterized protein n=1 Tax=Luteimonas terricola TaxID=645597 RepID=A0ABQ2ECE5_9GAMM|nr:hypothetical protein [Luteimonas terricola]GGK05693.1 hypothetical protein GCM10011394_13560 [Luteimonas terricola]